MTDSPAPDAPDPVDPDVELASAHLDGEARADERARIEEPAVQGHLAAFGDVADQVRAVPPAPTGLVDEHVAAALDAFPEDDRVVAIGSRRSRSWWERIPLGAVAAALVVVALVGAISLASSGEDDTDTAATALDSADDSAGTSGAGGGVAADDGDASAGAVEERATMESDEAFEATGTPLYDSYDALAEDLRAELAAPPDQAEAPTAEDDPAATSAPAGTGVAGDPCGAVSLLGLDPANVVLVRPVIVEPDAVTAVVHEAPDGRRLTVVDDATCEVVEDRLL